jgi:threonine synthase
MLWYLYDGNCQAVADLMAELKDFGTYAISEKAFAKLTKLFIGDSIDEDGTRAVIKKTWDEDGYVCDTHTAVAIGACRKADGKNPMLVASTASPFKFASSVLSALGETPDADEVVNLACLESGYGVACPPSLGNLKSMEIRFPQVIDRTEMADQLLDFVK